MKMEEHSVVRNATHTATAWAASPKGHLVRVEVLVTVSCVLLATLVFLGSGRLTSRSAAFRFVVWMALMLCYPAVSYTIGLIQSGSFSNDLVVVWACFLIGCADGIFACSVDHSDQQSRTVLNQGTQVLYVLLLLVSYASSLQLQLRILLLLLWVLNVAKLGMRLLWSLLSAGRDRVLTAENWLLSKYMAQEQVRSTWDFDADTMEGYEYVVTGEKDVQRGTAEYVLEVPDDNLVTVDRLWRCDVDVVSSKLKDLCLSFALFKLLRRRLSANPLHERDDIRTLVFVRRGLAGGGSDDHERMYRVIEVELGFLFDFFYARYPLPKQSLAPETAIFVASLSLSLCTVLSPALQAAAGNSSRAVTTGLLDVWLARFVIVLFIILEVFQYLSLVLSDWHKVKMVCRYVRSKHSWPAMEKLALWIMCRATLTRSYWSNSVGQYSLLHGCLDDERSWLARMPLHRWIKDQTSRIRTVTRPDLPVTVKRAIHGLLRSEWLSNLKYGDRTLQRNHMLHDFDWSTSRYQHGAVGSILVWHVATTVYQQLAASSHQQPKLPEREVATTLSNYCGYLLFQAPELVTDQMTDQIYERRRLTEALQLRVHQFLRRKRCRSKDDMFRELARFKPRQVPAEAGGYEEEILADGIKLAYQIYDEMPGAGGVRWKVLSEMWVELLLSVAPSDNVMVHVQNLATGGELITHMWALMTHAGIIDKPEKPDYGV